MKFTNKVTFIAIAAIVLIAIAIPSGMALASQPAKSITLHKTLPSPSLLNEVSTNILTVSFTSNKRGVLSLRTLQKAWLGISGPGAHYAGGFASLSIDVVLDGTDIYAVTKEPPSYTDPRVRNGTYPDSIDIFTTHYLTIGIHTLTLNYTSHYSGLAERCYTVGSTCGVHPTAGKAILVIP